LPMSATASTDMRFLWKLGTYLTSVSFISPNPCTGEFPHHQY
jgi:hypothetical protein